MKLQITDWSDDGYYARKRLDGETGPLVVAEIEAAEFTGFSYDGGRLDITGHPETIWISHQFSVSVVE